MTAMVVTLKSAVVAPVGTITLAGTVATDVLLLKRDTSAPPLGADALNVTVPTEGNRPITAVGFNLSEDSAAEPDDDTTVSPQEEKHSETAMSPTATIASGRWFGVRPMRRRVVQTNSQAAQDNSQTTRTRTSHGIGSIRKGAAGGRAARTVVFTIIVAIAGVVPIGVTAEGVTTQVEAAGKPLQLNVTR